MIRIRLPQFTNRVYRSDGAFWFPDIDAVVSKFNNILALIEGPGGKFLHPTHNIVTSDGDVFYAQSGAGEATTNAFDIFELFTGREVSGVPAKTDDRSNYDTLAIASTQKVHTAGFPKSNDTDPDNTGGGLAVTTFSVSYTKTDFNNPAITHGIITNVAPATAEPILTGFQFASSFAKTADDTLKIFVNHTHTGV